MLRFLLRRLLLTASRPPRRRDAGVLADSPGAGRSGAGDARRERVARWTSQSCVRRLGLDRPLIVQYGAFLKGAGPRRPRAPRCGRTSRWRRRSCERLPATFELAMAAMLVAILFAIPLGILAAVRAGTRIDHAATTLALLGISMPNFWLGPLLAIVFSIVARLAARCRAAARPRTSCCRRSRSARRSPPCSRG